MDTGSFHVHVPESASLTLPSGVFPVVSAAVDMTYGAIPSLTCVAAVDHGLGKTVYIHAGELPGISSSLSSALSSLSAGSEGSLSLAFDDGLDLNVSGWVVVGAGMTKLLGSGNEFGLQVTLMHPAAKVGIGGGYFMALKGGIPYRIAAESAADPLQAGRRVFERLSSAPRLSFHNFSDGGSVSAVMDSKLKEAAATLSERFEYRGTGWPLERHFSNKRALKRAICQYWVNPGHPEGSVMNCLSAVLTSTELAIVPDYKAEKLPVEPRFPWPEPTETIHETDIASIEFPGMDPDPICGVALPALGGSEQPALCSTHEMTMREGLDGKTAGSIAWMPESSGGGDPPGKFLTVSPPEWLENAAWIAASMSDQKNSTGEGPDSSKKREKAEVEASKILSGLVQGKVALMKHVFASKFKTMVQSAITTPFKACDFVPGIRCNVEIGGSTAYSGFVSRVVHSVDAAAGVGESTVFMTHCAPSGGYSEVSGITSPPMYS